MSSLSEHEARWTEAGWDSCCIEAFRNLTEAFQAMGMSMAEAADAINQIAALDYDSDVVDDESHGMTLTELIPETIAEWRRVRDEE